MIRHRIKFLIQDFIVFEIIFQNSNYFILMNSLFQNESSLPQNLKKKTRTWKRFGCLLLFCLVLLPRLIQLSHGQPMPDSAKTMFAPALYKRYHNFKNFICLNKKLKCYFNQVSSMSAFQKQEKTKTKSAWDIREQQQHILFLRNIKSNCSTFIYF